MEGIVSSGNLAVRTLTVFDEDGSGPGAAGLYIGGNFTTANGVPSGRIARLGCSGAPPCVSVSIIQQPVDLTGSPGETATFSVAATGSPTLIYQWRKDGDEIPGEVAASYTIDPVTPESAGSYDVVVKNPCGEATSNPATLTVTSQALGDLNCDGTYGYLSFGDINPFVLYLSNFSGWQATYPGCDPLVGDINGDGTYGQGSFGDINPFVALLSGG
jgi:hypothetical protein